MASKDDKSSSSSSVVGSNSSIQALNWAGSIPIVLTLAPSSLSSPTLPPPIHVLVSRQTFLHAGLEDAVRRLHQFAPTTVSFRTGLVRTEPNPGASNTNNDDDNKNDIDGSSCNGADRKNNNETTTATHSAATDGNNRNPVQRSSSSSSPSDTPPYPICWFEDEESQTALRWNLFTGVLYDLMNVQKRQKQVSSSSSSATAASSSSLIPWKIRLHFSAPYPISQILPLDNTNSTTTNGASTNTTSTCSPLLMQVWNFYKNSLKQALCLQNGNSKAAMNLSKENHGRLWDAIRLDNFGLYHQVHREQQSLSTTLAHPKRIPTRLLVDTKPPRHASSLYSDALTLGSLLAQQLPNHFIVQNNKQQHDSSSSSPPPSAAAAATATTTTTNNVIISAKDDCVLDWSVAGIVKPSLDIPVATLWENLCHADHFLYIIVHTC